MNDSTHRDMMVHAMCRAESYSLKYCYTSLVAVSTERDLEYGNSLAHLVWSHSCLTRAAVRSRRCQGYHGRHSMHAMSACCGHDGCMGMHTNLVHKLMAVDV